MSSLTDRQANEANLRAAYLAHRAVAIRTTALRVLGSFSAFAMLMMINIIVADKGLFRPPAQAMLALSLLLMTGVLLVRFTAFGTAHIEFISAGIFTAVMSLWIGIGSRETLAWALDMYEGVGELVVSKHGCVSSPASVRAALGLAPNATLGTDQVWSDLVQVFCQDRWAAELTWLAALQLIAWM